ncbi:DUF6455 family protein [Azospirillum halopraeferens]|uniref:DUF6455 family protein n=1 Tax=Azospirillum halopraeferens TaxID=34010 RepID=UPI000414311F|nr:DUF6455 family protein [Azospirillum halopraeferens]
MDGDDTTDERAVNMGRMMRTVGVDPEAAFAAGLGLPMARAVRKCSRCRTVAECSHWLADPDHADGDRHGFCPNADLFDRLRRG